MSVPAHVIKIGGSLLSHAHAPSRLRRWLKDDAHRDPNAHQVLIVGGGPPVDWLRQLDQRHTLDATAAHWAAIGMMDANTQALTSWLPDASLVSQWSQLSEATTCPGQTLFAAGQFLRDDDPNLPGIRLPIGWHVTSDAIAARIAQLLDARLTLLKSCEVASLSGVADWQRLADDRIVDKFFPTIVEHLSEAQVANPFVQHDGVLPRGSAQ